MALLGIRNTMDFPSGNPSGNPSGSRFLSAGEVEECIRDASDIFHVLTPGGKMPPEIISPYDNIKRASGGLDGFALRPPTIFDRAGTSSFSTRVYREWLKTGALSYSGIALPGMSYMEATGTFRLDSLGPGHYPGDYFLDARGLNRTLASLADVALREAVKQHLTEGGDERLHLSPSGGNKYFCPPHPVADMIIRGSCTCSPPAQAGFDAACRRLKGIWSEDETLEEAFDDVRARISRAMGIETQHHVVLHPSGTDAEFTPLLVGAGMARILGCSGVVNVVVGAGEVGSNTPNAAGGCHFSQFMPNGNVKSTAKLVQDFENGTQVLQLKARLADGTMVADFDQLVLESMKKAEEGQRKPFFIMHAVDGSKLGSHITSRELVLEAQRRYGDRVLVVLDACQARTERQELDWYLSHGAVVLITASKFYGAPGFCAAALVPDSASSVLKEGSAVPEGLGDYLTKFEVPSVLQGLHAALPSDTVNMGLLLRWTCGVTSMEMLARLGPEARDEAIRGWVLGAEKLIRKRRPQLELLLGEASEGRQQPSQLGGVNSIIGFKVRSEDGQRLLDAATLRRIHQWLTQDVSDRLPSWATELERRAAAVKCFIGQPVDLGDFAILRLAMGAALAYELGEDMGRLETALENDDRILDKVELLVKYHDPLQSTEQK